MALNSINTNISAYYAQQNIGKASTSASLSVARLSSGNRIIRASDDVASLAAGTSLRTQVTTLKTALINTAQGSSLLQVADGALSQIIDILQRQKSIAVQSGAGTLDNTARGFLNQEFQQLSAEINRLAGTTNFNSVTLLDGSVFDKVTTNTVATSAGAATATINFFSSTLATGKSITFNGVAFTATIVAGATGNNFSAVPASGVTAMVDSLVQRLNASTDTRISGATYSRSGNALVITQDAGGGAIGLSYTLDMTGLGASSVNTSVVASNSAASTQIFYLQGGTEVGIGFGRTTGSGVVGDNLLTPQNQIKGNQQITIPPIAGGAAQISAAFVGKAITFNIGGAMSFNFITQGTTPVNVTDIVVGSTIEETLDNAVQTLRAYARTAPSATASATGAPTNDRLYVFQQFEFDRTGRQINIERLAVGNVTTLAAAPAAVSIGINVSGAGPALAGNASFSNGSTAGGISTLGVNNAAFTGTIKGFTASYTGTSDFVNLSVTVGGIQYQAFNVNTNVLANTDVRFNSVNGGYFDVQFAANNGLNVTDQSNANTIAARLDAAFAGMNFYQKRDVSSYTGAGAILTNGISTGSLTGTSVKFQTNNFTDLAITSINVQAPAAGSANGIIEFVVNGETYRSADIGTLIRANSRIVMTSLTDSSKKIEFFGPSVTNGNALTAAALAIDFSTSDRAQSFEDALKAAFGFGSGGSALEFQVGTTTTDTLSVSIGTATTDKLYGGASIDVLTQASSAVASGVIEDAIDRATSIRADVGALQSRFNYASNNIESSLQNQDAARGVLLDTDIASESTAYATAQVQLQAGIAVLAQANLLPQNMLKLIG
jgi:flagellin